MTSVVVRSLSTASAQDWIDDLAGMSSTGKKPLVLNEDPFALSWASYRHWTQGRGRWPSFDILEVRDSDRVQGQAMRGYYHGRLVWDQIKKGQPLSSFRARLGELLRNTDSMVQSDLGILYRLPYFWVEDQCHDRVFDNRPRMSVLPTTHTDMVVDLDPICSVLVSRRTRERTQYWFDIDGTPVPGMLAVAEDNPLKSLLTSVLNRSSVKLQVHLRPVQMRGYHRDCVYYDLMVPRLP